MKIETSKLEGAPLDWAVGIALNGQPIMTEVWGVSILGRSIRRQVEEGRVRPSTDWSQGGPLIEARGMTFHLPYGWNSGDPHYVATLAGESVARSGHGPTHLVAAMRALVMVELGEVVDVPDELMEVPA